MYLFKRHALFFEIQCGSRLFLVGLLHRCFQGIRLGTSTHDFIGLESIQLAQVAQALVLALDVRDGTIEPLQCGDAALLRGGNGICLLAVVVVVVVVVVVG
jgi:hypothetical protein